MSHDDSKSPSSFPPWHGPFGPSPLRVLNSLTGEKEAFVPLRPRRVSWYICGPTVYDSAHLGHARAYVTFDLLRRVLEEYFGYDVRYVMNVTDLDDKIILRARKNFLLERYRREKEGAGESARAVVIDDIRSAYEDGVRDLRARREDSRQQREEAKNSRQRDEMEERIAQDELKLANLTSDQSTFLASLSQPSPPPLPALLSVHASALADRLDGQLGHTVTDPSIFSAHAKRYEREFLDDMAALNVREPSVLTRVTEYMDEIVRFVQRIIDRGIGYEANGSVYFSVSRFLALKDPLPVMTSDVASVLCAHAYGKLSPASVGNQALTAEAEGQLAASSTEKLHPSDFALWKSSKPGEPSWPSPWGAGRPGWHIECFGEDTRVLTNCGFLFIDELEAALANEQPLLYACYDVDSEQLMYRPGQLVLPPAGMHSSLIEFTDVNEGRRWVADSGAYGRGLLTADSAQTYHVSIRTTADHDIFAQVGHYDGAGHPHYRPSVRYEKRQAATLGALSSDMPLRFLACAANGRATTEDDATSFHSEITGALGLTAQQVAAFLELYGFWLGNGSLSFNHGGKKGGVSAIVFYPVKPSDLLWLERTLAVAGLRRGVDWRVIGNHADGSRLVAIVAEAWVVYFYKEYSKGHTGAAGALLVEEEEEEADSSALLTEVVGFSTVVVKSGKWFWWWVRRWLSAPQLRLIVRGLLRADGARVQGVLTIYTSSASFRDELVEVLLHAGYSTFFEVQDAAGTIKRWTRIVGQLSGKKWCTPEAHATLAPAEQAKYRAVKATVDRWAVRWAVPTSSKSSGACWPSLRSRTDVTPTAYAGRTWCVTVQHSDHLIVAQRAQRNEDGVVTKASRPIIIGQCSAMATDVIGDVMDVHSGGMDLKFPHHDNELAQSEAALGTHQWVNHFWHAGHLSIRGLKMSKSLKNFITIRQLLTAYSARQVRLLFLLSPWDSGINFSEDGLQAARARESELNEFFLNTAVVLRGMKDVTDLNQHWTAEDRRINALLQSTQDGVHDALCDNFDCPRVMALLSGLIQETNKYRQREDAKRPTLLSIVRFVDRMCTVFGIKQEADLGLSGGAASSDEALLDALCAFRDDVRSTAREWRGRKGEEAHGLLAVLATCDRLRDEALIELGVRVEDPPEPGKPSVWKKDDPAKLRRERAQKRHEELQQRIKGLDNRALKLAKDRERLADGAQSPAQLFAAQTDKWSRWAEDGRPTHDREGNELSKNALKAVSKAWDAREKAHREWQERMAKNPRALEDIDEELARVNKERAEKEVEAKRLQEQEEVQ